MAWESQQTAPQHVQQPSQSSWGAPPQPEQTPDQLLMQWKELANQLENIKALETAARNKCLKTFFAPSADHEGTYNHELGNGWILKGIFKLNYNLDRNDDKVDAALAKIEKSGENGKFVAERLVNWKPHMSVSEYRELNDIHKKLIGEVLTITAGQASLELVPPKAK